jgi:hypothetical protein
MQPKSTGKKKKNRAGGQRAGATAAGVAAPPATHGQPRTHAPAPAVAQAGNDNYVALGATDDDGTAVHEFAPLVQQVEAPARLPACLPACPPRLGSASHGGTCMNHRSVRTRAHPPRAGVAAGV